MPGKSHLIFQLHVSLTSSLMDKQTPPTGTQEKISLCPCRVQLLLGTLWQKETGRYFKRKRPSPNALSLKPNLKKKMIPKLHWINEENNKTVIQWKTSGQSTHVTQRMAVGGIHIPHQMLSPKCARGPQFPGGNLPPTHLAGSFQKCHVQLVPLPALPITVQRNPISRTGQRPAPVTNGPFPPFKRKTSLSLVSSF